MNLVSASTGCDLNNDSQRDLIAGAPKESDEEGRAYVFFGPFRDEAALTAEDADITLQSPDADTHWFGQYVECIPDINDDGFSDVLVEAVATNESGVETIRTYIFSGNDGALLQALNASKELGSPPPLPPCFGDIAPTGQLDGRVNVNDLLAVINGWGSCPAPPAECPADIAPEGNPDGVVNVNDLLAVINNWGDCDFDGDGMPDWWEAQHGLDPFDDDANGDADDDGVPNGQEYNGGTNPNNQDSDGDGVNDGQELNQGTDPTDPNSTQPSDDDVVYVKITLGDQGSGGCGGVFSDLWAIKVGSLVLVAKPSDHGGNPQVTNKTFVCSGSGGGCGQGNPAQPYRGVWYTTNPIKLQKGKNYPITVNHRATCWPNGNPDFDYTAYVQVVQTPGTTDPIPPHVLEDPDALLGQHWDSCAGCNPAANKTAWLRVPRIDLGTSRIDGNQPTSVLPESSEENPGAFLPLNNDDDDYDANNDADFQQTGAIAGESDLLPVVLKAIVPVEAAGEYKLTIPQHIRVWRSADRSDAAPVAETDTFPADQETTLYVEGITQNNGLLRINWNSGTTQFNDLDRLNLTVFTWLGPLNVPGFAAYQYTATGALGSSYWNGTVFGGSITSGSGTSNVTIRWGPGATVSRAEYFVNADYIWHLEVNVVKIEITPGSPTNMSYTNPSVQNGLVIHSSVPGPAMSATIDVASIEGPLVSGVMRGTRFIQMGFIQNGSFTAKHGDYNFESPPAPPPVPQRQTSSLEGTGMLIDYFTNVPASTPPWYDSQDATGSDGFHEPGDLVAPGALVMNVTDTPQLTATNTMQLTVSGVTDHVDLFAIVFDFNIYFAVRTTASVNGSDQVYTQRASANWTFNGTGSVNASSVWTSSASPNNGGSATFSLITSGAVVPVTTGTPINNLFATQTWTTGPQ